LAQQLVISVDAMGGDHGPSVVIGGIKVALERHPKARFLLHGDESVIRPLLTSGAVAQACEIRHTASSVSMDAKPSQVLRQGRESSMARALQAVAQGEAAVAISAGNTGALMALAMFALRTVPGISRPAIAAIWPARNGETVVLDVGANVDCDAAQLVSFAIMGAAFARVLFGLELPTVGLLNIGTEGVKGNEPVKAAAQILHATPLAFKFQGFVEGTDISASTVDVVVTDGFTGNVALKTAEGTAKLVAYYLSTALRRTWINQLGALLSSGAFRALKAKLDPRSVNGGVFLGLNGLVVKSHGGTDAVGFASALDMAVDMASADLVSKIAADAARMKTSEPVAGALPATISGASAT